MIERLMIDNRLNKDTVMTYIIEKVPAGVIDKYQITTSVNTKSASMTTVWEERFGTLSEAINATSNNLLLGIDSQRIE